MFFSLLENAYKHAFSQVQHICWCFRMSKIRNHNLSPELPKQTCKIFSNHNKQMNMVKVSHFVCAGRSIVNTKSFDWETWCEIIWLVSPSKRPFPPPSDDEWFNNHFENKPSVDSSKRGWGQPYFQWNVKGTTKCTCELYKSTTGLLCFLSIPLLSGWSLGWSLRFKTNNQYICHELWN